MDLFAISGSLRSESSKTRILRTLKTLAPPGNQVSLYEGMASLPPFDPELETEEALESAQALEARAQSGGMP